MRSLSTHEPGFQYRLCLAAQPKGGTMNISFRAVTHDFTAAICRKLVNERNRAGAGHRSAAIPFFSLFLLIICFAAEGYAQHYRQTNLVSDVPGLAKFTDPDLVNPWGLIASGTSPWWVADNGTGLSTLYNGAGVKQSLVVTVATPPGDTDPATPTGIVFNGGSDFKLTSAANSAARFIFDTEDGTISGWSPAVDATHTILKVNNAGSAIYKGLTIAQAGGVNFLYAANFFAGTVDVFDTNYAPVSLGGGAFVDQTLPEGFAPFNVQNIDGKVYVAYAKQDEEREDEVAGRKLGYVDVFDGSGNLLQRFENGPWMNAPWGLALAPSTGFGKSSGKLLVGMFGSGQIATFDPATGEFNGLLRDRHGKPIQVDGLWALRFGNGGNAGPTTTLFFTAGIDDEEHGLFGTITAIPNGNGNHDD
jgi:uncharacterized protein (TIGR03118 family)